MTTRFILIRHGQTEWNRGAERFRGHADLPLNETGLAQAQKMARRLANEKIAALYASPLQRALQTAQPLARPARIWKSKSTTACSTSTLARSKG